MDTARRGLLVLAALAIAAVPAAGSEQRAATLEAALTPQASGASAVDLHMTWADPGEPNGKPKQVKKLRLAFPVGTKIDTKGMARCVATDAQVHARGLAAC